MKPRAKPTPLVKRCNDTRPTAATKKPPLRSPQRGNGWSAFLSGLGLVAAGALVGLAVSVALFWDRLVAMVFSLRP